MEKIAPNSREGGTLLKSIKHQRSQGQAQANHRNSRGEKKGAVKTESNYRGKQKEGCPLPPQRGKERETLLNVLNFIFIYVCACLSACTPRVCSTHEARRGSWVLGIQVSARAASPLTG